MLPALGLRRLENQAPPTESEPSSIVQVKPAGRKRLEKIFNENHLFVWRLLRRLGLDRERAADMTQQAFLIATERLDGIKHGSERAFLFGTALRLARTAKRTDRRWVLEEDMDVRANSGPRTEELADRHRAIDLLDRVLATMPGDLVTVFILFELEGLSAPEVARLVGIPVGTAASRLRRAREVFRIAVSKLRRASLRGVPS
jgi:RNA polymerase sigma-70 factor (ECF subfamily)